MKSDLVISEVYVPQYPNLPCPVTNLIHVDTGIFPETGKKLFSDDKRNLYSKLKTHKDWQTLSKEQKKLAKRYIRKYVKVIIYEFLEVEKALAYAKDINNILLPPKHATVR